MDIKTGHLINDATDEQIESGFYKRIPNDLQDEAIRLLKGEKEVFVNLKENSLLSQWAKKERNKNKNKMVKKSRKVNRK